MNNIKINGDHAPLVSVIVPAHNAEQFINKCVNSVLRQSYSNVELIVVENGSTDHTTEILENLSDRRINLLHSEKGVCAARNTGIQAARGEFILFLDADDWLGQDALEMMTSVMENDVHVVTARYYGDPPFESYHSRKYPPGDLVFIKKCLLNPTKRGNVTGNMYRTSFIKNNALKFDTRLTHAEDSVFFFELLTHGASVVDLEAAVYHVRVNPESAVRNSGNVEFYIPAIEIVISKVERFDLSLRNALMLFTLNELLIIFVHDICSEKHGKSMSMQIADMKKVCSRAPFFLAIQSAKLNELELPRRTLLWCLQKRLYLIVFFAVKLRIQINHRKVKMTC